MTIAKQLNYDFSKGRLYLYESNGKVVYFENSYGYWSKRQYDSNGNQIYYENSNGHIEDNRPYVYHVSYENHKKAKCEGKTVVVDGIEYELKEIMGDK